MFKFFTKAILTSVAALFADFLLSGITIKDTITAMIVALVLGLLNTFVKPILTVITISITVFTMGLFLLVLNVLMVYWASKIVEGFVVESWWSALLFSFIVSITSSILEKTINKYTKKEDKIQEF